MSPRTRSGTAVAVVILLLAFFALTANAQQRWTYVRAGTNEVENRILRELDSETTLEFVETPLIDVLAYLSDLHGLQCVLDIKALEAVGIGSETPITRNLKGISLRSALRLILTPLDLTYVIDDEVLQVTTPEQATERTELRVYNVGPMLDEDQAAHDLAGTIAQVLAQPQRNGPMNADPFSPAQPTAHAKWQSISIHGQLLIVRDTRAGHEALAELLDAISDAQTAFGAAPAAVDKNP